MRGKVSAAATHGSMLTVGHGCVVEGDDAVGKMLLQALCKVVPALQAAAEAEIAAAEQDVAELERQLALHTTPPTASATDVSPMDQVQMLLAGLIKNLADNPYVPADQVQQPPVGNHSAAALPQRPAGRGRGGV